MRARPGSILAALAAVLLPAPTAAPTDALRDGFRDPPKAARPAAYWLWLNGHVDGDHVEAELTALRDAGMRGLCLFDMGARGEPAARPPAGPPFLGDESVAAIAHAVRVAGRLGLDVQLSVSSSWDMGGAWVEPRHASKGLYFVEVPVAGPATFDAALPLPALPAAAPRGADGRSAFLQEVAVLAIPADRRALGHDFVLALEPPGPHRLTHAVFTNAAGPGLPGTPAKGVSLAVSEAADPDEETFREVWRGELEAHGRPQRFELPGVTACFVRLRVLDGHDPAADRVALGEFALFNAAGVNVAGSHAADRTRDGAQLLGRPRAMGVEGAWTADNINDGVASGPAGTWCSPGTPAVEVPEASSVIDLTGRVGPDGRLRWDVPPGRWLVIRYVCTNTGERLKVPSPASDGLATDHLSAEATRSYLEYVLARLRTGLGPDLCATALTHLYLASYEVRGLLWTPDLPAQFRRYRGYDLRPYLPALAGHRVGPGETTRRFLYDWEKTLGELLVDAYYRTASAVAREAGLGIESEAGGPGPPIHSVPVDALTAQGAVDEVRGEFWPRRPEADRLWVVKETACAAHIYGKPRVRMEAFTSTDHWQDAPGDLKPAADRAFAEGMNSVVWHTVAHQPPAAGRPGWVYDAGTHLNPNETWWREAPAFLDYLARCSYLLQRGEFVADVLYYHGDQGANFVPPRAVQPGLGPGYDYDVTDALAVRTRMSARDGRLVVRDGPSYAALVLPERAEIDPDVLESLEPLVRAGVPVIGPKPVRAPGLSVDPARDQRVRRLAEKLWGDGPGRIIAGRTPREVLEGRGIGPDYRLSGGREDAAIDFVHRRDDEAEAEIYFVRNVRNRPAAFEATFRVSGRVPERWDPVTGQVTPIHTYLEAAGGTTVALRLPPFGATFVVFRRRAAETPAPLAVMAVDGAYDPEVTAWDGHEARVSLERPGRYRLGTADGRGVEFGTELPPPIELAGPWEVAFPDGRGAPASARFDRLVSWTDRTEEDIRYYSGRAIYTAVFDLPADWLGEGRRVRLDLGDLGAVGSATLNGQPLGVVWTPPYTVDATTAARPGRNRLEVVVVNTWNNRLVGDARRPPAEATTRTNITGTGGQPWRDVPLRRSGLFGPVRLVPIREVVVRPEARRPAG